MYLLFMQHSTILFYEVFNKCKISYLQKEKKNAKNLRFLP